LFCGKNLKRPIGENKYYSEGIKIKTGKEEKVFCSFECLNKYNNQQKQTKSNQQDQAKDKTKNSNQQDNSNDKT
jgi:hypothetical protein